MKKSELFKQKILTSFENNLSKVTCNTLANMLMLDHKHRLTNQMTVKQYLHQAIFNLQNFLQSKIILCEDFSVAMMLFTIAISSRPPANSDWHNIIEADKSLIIENLILLHFNNYSKDEKIKVKTLIRSLLDKENSYEIINFIHYDPKFFKDLALTQEIDIAVIRNTIKKELSFITTENLNQQRKSGYLKNFISSFATIISSAIAAALIVQTSGAILPLIILPSTITSLKYVPNLSNMLTSKLFNLNNRSWRINNLSYLKSTLITKLKSISMEYALGQQKNMIANQLITPLTEMKLENIDSKLLDNKIIVKNYTTQKIPTNNLTKAYVKRR